MTRRNEADARKGTYWLVGVEGKARRVRLAINTPLLIGRGASNHIVLDDPRISRQHARLAPERDGVFLQDLASANGSIVNGLSVTKHRLAPDDVIRIGRYTFRIDFVADEGVAAADLETPTLIATESVARMLVGRDSYASAERPMVDLTQLEDAHQKLGTLYGFLKAISSTIDRGELLRLIGGKLREVYPRARSVAIYLRTRPKETMLGGYPQIPPSEVFPGALSTPVPPPPPFQLAHFTGASLMPDEPLVPDDVTNVVEHATAILTGGAPESIQVGAGTDMFAPMIDRGTVLGVIHVAADERPAFGASDLELLNGMAATAAVMLQNTQVHDESLLRDRLKYDLELAAKIQKSFLPREVISVEGLELFAEYRAAYTIGGDFYDVFWVGDQKLAVFIGDISGKGVAAALLMARISSELRAAALAHVEPVAVLNAMNEAILSSGQPELFFTAIYLTFDVKTGAVNLANAGHPTPYRCKQGSPFEAITAGASSAIGILEDPGFSATSFTLDHGDSLVLYTDGVVEASDARGGLYGSERLEACLSGLTNTRPIEIAEKILRSVEEYATNSAMSDDLTLFICHRSASKSLSLQPQRRSGQLQAVNVAIPKLPRPPTIRG
jgi:serine phosphatase RsbU (regulator of sigma subunit)